MTSACLPQQDVWSQISDRDFELFSALMRRLAGIQLGPAKKSLVCGRLAKRLLARDARTYADYYRLITSIDESRELQICVNLLTTNETYFFREPRHFEFLGARVMPTLRQARRPVRIWSAACSSGEEPYSLAIVAAETLGMASWEVLGTDISTAALEKAESARYPLAQSAKVPPTLLRRYFLKGVGRQEGTMMVDNTIRGRVRFCSANLHQALPAIGDFDVIFLRNVLIYFDDDGKREVVARVLRALRPEGHLFVGHSESLTARADDLVSVAPAVYRRRSA